jgi:Flp pilus assembly protein TadD
MLESHERAFVLNTARSLLHDLEVSESDVLNIALSQLALRDYDRALVTFDQVTRLNPVNRRALREMGIILMQHHRRFDDALKCFVRASELGEDVSDYIQACRQELE